MSPPTLALRGYQGDSLSQHLTRWNRALDARARWTREAWVDVRFEAGKSWTQDEIDVFRGQNRSPSNYNLIRPTVEIVCGIEQQTRSDLQAYPRTQAMEATAQSLTGFLKYVDSQNRTPTMITRSFRDATVTGIGWLECCQSQDPTAEQVEVSRLNPFDFWPDPNAREIDYRDATEGFRARWLHPEYLAVLFPDLKGELPTAGGYGSFDPLSHTADETNRTGDRPPVSHFNQGSGDTPFYGPGHGTLGIYALEGYTQEMDRLFRVDRYAEMVLVIERWYMYHEAAMFAKFRDGLVLESAPGNYQQIAAGLVNGTARLVRGIAKRVRSAMFTDTMKLQDVASPYDHSELPFVAVPAYRDEDGEPMGLVRSLRDPQKEFNARRTHLLKRAIQRQTWFEEGSFPDETEAAEQIAKHDGWVRVTEGALRNGKVILKDDNQTAPVEANLLEAAGAFIQDQAGITRELLGQATNATSGKAIAARQSQGQTALFSLFENRNQAQIELGELEVSLIQQLYTDEMEVRLTGARPGGIGWLRVNAKTGDPEVPANDITQGRFDLQIAQKPVSATDRQAQADMMGQFMSNMPPEVKLPLASYLAEAMDMPEQFVSKMDEVIQRLIAGPQPGAPQGPPPTIGQMSTPAPPGAPPHQGPPPQAGPPVSGPAGGGAP